MSDALGILAIAGVVLGLAIAAVAFVALFVGVRDPALRTRALGFVYVGMAAVAGSAGVLVLSRVADGRMSLVAGAIPVVLLFVMAGWLRLTASREFRRSRSYRPE